MNQINWSIIRQLRRHNLLICMLCRVCFRHQTLESIEQKEKEFLLSRRRVFAIGIWNSLVLENPFESLPIIFNFYNFVGSSSELIPIKCVWYWLPLNTNQLIADSESSHCLCIQWLAAPSCNYLKWFTRSIRAPFTMVLMAMSVSWMHSIEYSLTIIWPFKLY